jgi:hypothetical protein
MRTRAGRASDGRLRRGRACRTSAQLPAGAALRRGRGRNVELHRAVHERRRAKPTAAAGLPGSLAERRQRDADRAAHVQRRRDIHGDGLARDVRGHGKRPADLRQHTICAESSGTTSDSTSGTTVRSTTTCTGTSTCVCHINGTLDVTTHSGTYGAASASATLDLSSTPLTSSFAYCVEENRLHLMKTVSIVTTNPPSDTTIILSDIVAQRQ